MVTADRALPGEIECFGRWPARFGEPEWHRNPLNGRVVAVDAVAGGTHGADGIGDVGCAE
jgi:hypothetical protein